MGQKAEGLGLVAFETLPWACRFNVWGKTATVLGTKEIGKPGGATDKIPGNDFSAKYEWMYVRIELLCILYGQTDDKWIDGCTHMYVCMCVILSHYGMFLFISCDLFRPTLISSLIFQSRSPLDPMTPLQMFQGQETGVHWRCRGASREANKNGRHSEAARRGWYWVTKQPNNLYKFALEIFADVMQHKMSFKTRAWKRNFKFSTLQKKLCHHVLSRESTAKMKESLWILCFVKISGLLGVEPKIVECPNIMSISLGNPGQVIHPGVQLSPNGPR